MPLEEGVLGALIVGFTVVIGIAILVILLLWRLKKNNNSGYVWTLLHLLLFSAAMYYLLKAISFNYDHVMASEENSSQLGIAGIIWVFSILCLIIGIYKFSNKSN